MEIKVGMYVRFNNWILKIELVRQDGWIFFEDNDLVSGIGKLQYDNCVFANTPQELIQAGDMIEVKECRWHTEKDIFLVKKPRHEGEFVYGMNHRTFEYAKEDIIAIYTPNKNKTQYTRQWVK